MLPKILPRNGGDKRVALRRKLMRKEAEIGGKLFGPVPKGHRREFFCLDRHTWVWHEEWFDQSGQHRSMTTRYEISPQGILKAQDGKPYQPLHRDEARNLYHSTQLYRQRVAAYYQGLLQAA